MQHLGMSRISHAQEDPGRRTVPRIDLSPTPPQKPFYHCSNDDQADSTTTRCILVYVQTIRNRLHAAGLKSRVPAKKPCLSQRHRAARLQFARNHVRWNRQQWRTVTFSDESRFCLRHIDVRLRVMRQNGERHAEVNMQPRQAYNGGSVMVWAGVTADRRTDLVVVPGILTGQRYIDEILRPHVVPFLRPMGNNGIFQDDNARPHQARIVDGFLQANNVRRLEWPAMSPDLSCIEHVWDVLGRAVQKRMTELRQISGVSLERNGSESLKL